MCRLLARLMADQYCRSPMTIQGASSVSSATMGTMRSGASTGVCVRGCCIVILRHVASCSPHPPASVLPCLSIPVGRKRYAAGGEGGSQCPEATRVLNVQLPAQSLGTLLHRRERLDFLIHLAGGLPGL